MDFDENIFSRADLQNHLAQLGVLYDYDLGGLLKRTTKNTRSGNEFGFKPSTLEIGSSVANTFYAGQSYTVETEGTHPQSKRCVLEDEENDDDRVLPSSFWFRFHEQVS